jgi:MFS family permease
MWEGAYANIFIVLTGGAFLTGLALYLGANDFEIGVLAAIPFLMQSAQLLSSSIFKDPVESRHGIARALAASRLLWLGIIPLVLFEGAWQLPLLIVLVIISSFLTMISTPAWLARMAGIVPNSIRGSYFSKRNAAIAGVTVVATITGSLVLDAFKANGAEQYGFAILTLVAVIGAIFAWRAMTKIPGERLPEAAKPTEPGSLMAPLKDRPFRRVLIVFAVWNIATGVSASFFAPHMLLNLKMSFFQIGLYSCTTAGVAILSSTVWGRLVDRFGSKPILNICAFGIGAIPLVWLFPTADSKWILIPEAFYSGLLWAGFNLAGFTMPLDRSPKSYRTAYLAVFATITGLAFFVASSLSGVLAELLSDWSWSLAGMTFVNYHLLFVLSAITRLFTAGLLASFHEPSEIRLPVVVQLMGYAVLKRVSIGRQILPFVAEASSPDDQYNKPETNSHN